MTTRHARWLPRAERDASLDHLSWQIREGDGIREYLDLATSRLWFCDSHWLSTILDNPGLASWQTRDSAERREEYVGD